MNQEKFYIPKHLDDAPKFLLWDIDEAFAFIGPLFFSVMIGKGLLGLFLAFGIYKAWKKVKGSGGQNLIKCLIYWYYPKSILGLKKTPDSSIKNFIG